jgi:hypothetical protein
MITRVKILKNTPLYLPVITFIVLMISQNNEAFNGKVTLAVIFSVAFSVLCFIDFNTSLKDKVKVKYLNIVSGLLAAIVGPALSFLIIFLCSGIYDYLSM